MNPNLTPGFTPGFGQSKLKYADRLDKIAEIDHKTNIVTTGTINAFLERPALPQLTDSLEEVVEYGAEWGPYLAQASELERTAELNSYKQYKKEYLGEHQGNDEGILDEFSYNSRPYLETDVRIIDLTMKDRERALKDPRTWSKDHYVDESQFAIGWTIGYRRWLHEKGSASMNYSHGVTRRYATAEVDRVMLTNAGDIYVLGKSGYEDSSAIRKMEYESVTAVRSFQPRENSSEAQEELDTKELIAYAEKKHNIVNYIDFSHPTQILHAEDILDHKDDKQPFVTPRDISAGLIRLLTANGLTAGSRKYYSKYQPPKPPRKVYAFTEPYPMSAMLRHGVTSTVQGVAVRVLGPKTAKPARAHVVSEGLSSGNGGLLGYEQDKNALQLTSFLAGRTAVAVAAKISGRMFKNELVHLGIDEEFKIVNSKPNRELLRLMHLSRKGRGQVWTGQAVVMTPGRFKDVAPKENEPANNKLVKKIVLGLRKAYGKQINIITHPYSNDYIPKRPNQGILAIDHPKKGTPQILAEGSPVAAN